MKRAVYDKQFKIEAVKLATSTMSPVSEVARNLGINDGALRRWINEYEEHGDNAFPGNGKALLNSAYELKKLEKENEELRMENDLLKKLRAFLKAKSV